MANLKLPILILLATGLGLAGCARLNIAAPTDTALPTSTATVPVVSITEIPPTPAAPATLRLWLPAQFDPANGSPAGNLLQARLDEFARRMEIDIEVRVKSESGAGGLLDALSAANAAAPLALPDLVLLPRPQLETAALKGLIYPLDGLVEPVGEGDWYPFAEQLARLQDSTFGLPFAGDGQVLVYRPESIEQPPADWPTTLALGKALIFSAADEQAIFTLSEFLAAGGHVQDEEGRPALQTRTLTGVLSFYQQGNQAEVFPVWITQLESDGQSWQAFNEGRADQAVILASQYLAAPSTEAVLTTIPTPDGEPFTLATGWVWALSSPQTGRRALSVDLAEYLTEGEFLSRWTAAAGYLPPRASALSGWPDASISSLVSAIVQSAQVIPPNDVLAVLGPALQLATVEVLKAEAEPAQASREAIRNLQAPE
ncbi:MAG TPA: extracellular solute-binding protein [Anaerolineales bacterium]|nr:extracellular solute-binding protein [Anaerolineales bacterium]